MLDRHSRPFCTVLGPLVSRNLIDWFFRTMEVSVSNVVFDRVFIAGSREEAKRHRRLQMSTGTVDCQTGSDWLVLVRWAAAYCDITPPKPLGSEAEMRAFYEPEHRVEWLRG